MRSGSQEMTAPQPKQSRVTAAAVAPSPAAGYRLPASPRQRAADPPRPSRPREPAPSWSRPPPARLRSSRRWGRRWRLSGHNHTVHHPPSPLFGMRHLPHVLTCGGLEVGLLLLLDGLRVVVGGAFVHGQRGDLLVGFPAVVAVVGLARRVDHVVLVEAGVLCEALLAAGHRAHVGLLTWGEQPRQLQSV